MTHISENPGRPLRRTSAAAGRGSAAPTLCQAREYGAREVRAMISELKRHDVRVLLLARHTQAETAALTGVSVRTVRRVGKGVSSGAAQVVATRPVGRPSKVAQMRELILHLLVTERNLRGCEILRRARLAGYQGRKTALYGLVASLRSQIQWHEGRTRGLPGELSQHDGGRVSLTFDDGTRCRACFIATRLSYSRWIEVALVPNLDLDTVVRALAGQFEAIGGVPLLAVFDGPKSLSQAAVQNGGGTDWRPAFASFALELGIGIEFGPSYHPARKGGGERLAGWVMRSFFAQRCFRNESDLAARLSEWKHALNTQRQDRLTGAIPAARLEEERLRLRPLRVTAETLALRFPVSVGSAAEEVFRAARNAPQPQTAGSPATLFLYPDRARIVEGPHSVEQPRRPGKPAKAPEARPTAVSGILSPT